MPRSNRGGPVEGIRPGEKHRHGTSPTAALTHIAVRERLGGKTVE